MKMYMLFHEGRELTLNAFKSGKFPLNSAQGEGLKILTPKYFKDYQQLLHK